MATLLTAAAIALVATLFFMRRAAVCVRRRRLARAGAHTLSCGICGSVLGVLAVIAVSYLGYERLTAEQVVATVPFSRVASYEYRARVMIDGERDQFFLLTGDEWQIDARIVSWQPPATILGLDPIYRLERLSGRYTEVDQERSEPRSVHAPGRRRSCSPVSTPTMALPPTYRWPMRRSTRCP